MGSVRTKYEVTVVHWPPNIHNGLSTHYPVVAVVIGVQHIELNSCIG